jgi:hypothetical protein
MLTRSSHIAEVALVSDVFHFELGIRKVMEGYRVTGHPHEPHLAPR